MNMFMICMLAVLCRISDCPWGFSSAC